MSDCRIGIYDFENIKSRICGVGHDLKEECANMLDSVNICALHKNRKEILKHTLNTYFPNQLKIEIQSLDIYEDGTIVAIVWNEKLKKHLDHLKKH